MKITYDKEADAAYFYFKESQRVSKTVPITRDIILDFNAKGKLLGIEILNASSCIAPKDLRSADFLMLSA